MTNVATVVAEKTTTATVQEAPIASMHLHRFVGKSMGVVFPVLPVKIDYFDGFGRSIQALEIDIDTIWVGAWDVIGLDATNPAENMGCCHRVKTIGDCFFLAAK